MKIGVIGGTGDMGRAVAAKLALKHEITIGSRDPQKAEAVARTIPGGRGSSYEETAETSEACLITVPYAGIEIIEGLAKPLGGKLAISMINPMIFEDGFLHYGLKDGSAAERIASLLPESGVATAFNNVPVVMMKDQEVVSMDILIAASSAEAFQKTADIVRCVPNLRPLYAGPLSQAQVVERITPLVLNLAKWNKTRSLTTRFVSRTG